MKTNKKDSLHSFFPNIFSKALLLIMGIIFLSMFIKNTIIFSVVAMLIIFFVSRKIKSKMIPIVIFVFSVIIRIIAVILLKTPIESDFKILYDASISLLNGDVSFNQLTYFKLWGYQIGQVVYQTILLSIWNNVLFIKIINCLISSGIVILVYLIGRELFKERTSIIISFLYSIFMFPILFNSVLSNQILSTFLLYLGIYILFAKRFDSWKKTIRYSLVGIILGISNILRPEAIVILTTIFIFLIYYLRKNNIKETIIKMICIFGSYFVITNLVSLILITTNISPVGLSNNDPLWKFVLGFNHETAGLYSKNDEHLVGNKEAELEIIKERTIDSVEKIPILFVKKIRNFWFSSDIYWSNNYLENKTVTFLGIEIDGSIINEALNSFNKNIYYFMYICLFIGLLKNIKTKKSELMSFLSIFICVYVGVYLLIEIMPRYAYCPQVALFILSGFGIEYIINKLEVKRI